MEIYLALVVGMAVIFFGALISLGNEPIHNMAWQTGAYTIFSYDFSPQ
jgi:hypothetical protein